jgi:fatty-acyl-CoA synthase
MSSSTSSEPTFQLADLWETLVDAGADAECLVVGVVRHTRRSLDTAANRVANALAGLGIRTGDHVGIYSKNRAEYVESLLGCWKLGARPINLNWRYVLDELRYVAAEADLRAVIVEREYVPLLDELRSELPALGNRLVLDDASDSPTSSGDRYADVVGAASPDRPDRAGRSGDDVYMLYTGGTTGMPKGVMWRHEDFFYGCLLGGNPLAPISRPADIAGHATPSFQLDALVLGQLMHGAGQWLTFISLFSGNRAIVYSDRSFSPEHVLDLIERERPRTVGLVGDAMGRPIAEAALADPGRWDLSSLVSIGNGGAMLSESVKAQLVAAFPTAVMADSFGASETGAAGSNAGGDSASLPVFKVDANTSVLDPETLEPVPAGSGESGLLARRGHIPIGYWNDPEKTARTFRTDARGVRWVLPGDFAVPAADGTIVLLGRGSGCINTGGEKVFPEEVEAALRSHPDVLDAIVVGAPDDRFGQQVVALVQVRRGHAEPSLADLQAHSRTKLAGYKIPRRVIYGAAPRTNLGKADYAAASRLAADRVDAG